MSESVEQLAEKFHETYERLAPSFGYKTRWQTRRPWAAVPDDNKRLMVAVVSEVCGPLLARLAEKEEQRARWQESAEKLEARLAEAEKLFEETREDRDLHLLRADAAEADRDEWKARAEILEGWHETALACQEALVKAEADRDRYKLILETLGEVVLWLPDPEQQP